MLLLIAGAVASVLLSSEASRSWRQVPAFYDTQSRKFCTGCPVSPRTAWIAAHCVDNETINWQQTTTIGGNIGGIAMVEWKDTTSDYAFLRLPPGTPEFDRFFQVVKREPQVLTPLILVIPMHNNKLTAVPGSYMGLGHPENPNAFYADGLAVPGASGGCLLVAGGEDDGKAAGIHSGTNFYEVSSGPEPVVQRNLRLWGDVPRPRKESSN